MRTFSTSKIVKFLLGDPETVRLENRVFNSIILLIMLNCFMPIISNIIFGLPMVHNLIALGAVSVTLVGYTYSRKIKNYYTAVPIVVPLLGVCTGLIWLYAEGSTGSAAYYCFTLVALVSIACKDKHKKFFVPAVYLMVFILFYIEIFYPALLPPAYKTALSKSVDNAIGLFLCLTNMLVMLLILKEQYDYDNIRLSKALSEIKTLKGIIPICAKCKKIRDDKGYWNQVEEYVRDNSDAEFTHGICPECAKELYGYDINDKTNSSKQI